MQLSEATLKRLILMYRTLSRMIRYSDDVSTVSSAQLGELIGVPSHSIRKDLSNLGEIGSSGKGYDVEKLTHFLAEKLELNRERKACVVGLGKIGTALIEYETFSNSGFEMVAGFDSDMNRVDTIRTTVPVYPAYKIAEVLAKENIEMAFLAVPAMAVAKTIKRLKEGGILGIVNLSPVVLTEDDVFIQNIDLTGELTMLSAMISVNNSSDKNSSNKNISNDNKGGQNG